MRDKLEINVDWSIGLSLTGPPREKTDLIVCEQQRCRLTFVIHLSESIRRTKNKGRTSEAYRGHFVLVRKILSPRQKLGIMYYILGLTFYVFSLSHKYMIKLTIKWEQIMDECYRC